MTDLLAITLPSDGHHQLALRRAFSAERIKRADRRGGRCAGISQVRSTGEWQGTPRARTRISRFGFSLQPKTTQCTGNGNPSRAPNIQARLQGEALIPGADGEGRPGGGLGGGGCGFGAGHNASGVTDRATGRSEVPTPSGAAGTSLHERLRIS